jgi:hypothetical protein
LLALNADRHTEEVDTGIVFAPGSRRVSDGDEDDDQDKLSLD